MKTFKLVDIALQLFISIYLLFLFNSAGYNNSFFCWVLALGGLQVISCLVHLIAWPVRQHNKSRRVYEIALLFAIFGSLLILYYMLFIGPVMAAWYFITCLVETLRYYRHPRPTFF